LHALRLFESSLSHSSPSQQLQQKTAPDGFHMVAVWQAFDLGDLADANLQLLRLLLKSNYSWLLTAPNRRRYRQREPRQRMRQRHLNIPRLVTN
jgi:hypothetical protein